MSDFETLQQGRGTVTGTCDYDGYIYVNARRSSGFASALKVDIEINGTSCTLVGSADGGNFNCVMVAVQKGDYYSIWVDQNGGDTASSFVKARWFKNRDYSNR